MYLNQEAAIDKQHLMAVIEVEKVQAEARKQAHLQKVNYDPFRIDTRICWSKDLLTEIVARETGLAFTVAGQYLLGRGNIEYLTPEWLYTEYKNAWHPQNASPAEAITWMESNANE